MSAYDKQIAGSHYQGFKIQPSKFVIENKMLFPEGCAIKYICRHINKGGEQDLQKAKHYIDMIIERDYGDETEKSNTFTPTFKANLEGSEYDYSGIDHAEIKVSYEI